MSAKKYVLRANCFAYNDEHFNLYDTPVGVCAAYDDFDTAMAAWKEMEFKTLKTRDLSNTQSFF